MALLAAQDWALAVVLVLQAERDGVAPVAGVTADQDRGHCPAAEVVGAESGLEQPHPERNRAEASPIQVLIQQADSEQNF
ncbi:hypothetical protein [Leptolyngbya sp. FACHB-261]|uniref:hypothetical protein n=1 Tax=Leptolyngbya sp. FACHB-261 TaxID=2692806 RepID=UPI0018EFCE64|nr:hypothetical protein [Leptolyngbya sp. FACHB-261]